VSHRLPWDKRGSVRLDQMPDTSPETLKGLSDHDLFRFVAGYKPGTEPHLAGQSEIKRHEPHLAGQSEIKRRENATARMAVGISILSLCVAIIALVSSWMGWSGR
jgi:hypothetical protein